MLHACVQTESVLHFLVCVHTYVRPSACVLLSSNLLPMVVDVAGCTVGLYYYVDVLGISCVVIGLMASMKGNLDIIDFLQRSTYLHTHVPFFRLT